MTRNNRQDILLTWDYCWAAITAILAIYLGIKGADFAFDPRTTIPDPSQDVHFGYILMVFSGAFCLVTAANLGALPWKGLPTFLACAFILGFAFIFYRLITGSYSAWIVVIGWAIELTPILIAARAAIHAAREGRDPEQASDDALAAWSSRSWWQYLMYKNTRPRR